MIYWSDLGQASKIERDHIFERKDGNFPQVDDSQLTIDQSLCNSLKSKKINICV